MFKIFGLSINQDTETVSNSALAENMSMLSEETSEDVVEWKRLEVDGMKK